MCSKQLNRDPRSCKVLTVTAFRTTEVDYREEGGWRETMLSYTLQPISCYRTEEQLQLPVYL